MSTMPNMGPPFIGAGLGPGWVCTHRTATSERWVNEPVLKVLREQEAARVEHERKAKKWAEGLRERDDQQSTHDVFETAWANRVLAQDPPVFSRHSYSQRRQYIVVRQGGRKLLYPCTWPFACACPLHQHNDTGSV